MHRSSVSRYLNTPSALFAFQRRRAGICRAARGRTGVLPADSSIPRPQFGNEVPNYSASVVGRRHHGAYDCSELVSCRHTRSPAIGGPSCHFPIQAGVHVIQTTLTGALQKIIARLKHLQASKVRGADVTPTMQQPSSCSFFPFFATACVCRLLLFLLLRAGLGPSIYPRCWLPDRSQIDRHSVICSSTPEYMPSPSRPFSSCSILSRKPRGPMSRPPYVLLP